ncbi:MAG: sulfurtransferase TusA family protein [Gammaproteobacteria bacterium]|jgi:tRNA 2-thiouridine synthesizing protein A|nr:sulfurtransferase TusA family protein [Gammaproteobacteria bacterium]HQY69870.1 sulfurtransferase TusA family protein [Pseudomonadales bacterium]
MHEVDARGMSCPLPLLKAKKALNGMGPGERVRVLSTDPGSVRDFRVFCEQSGNELLEFSCEDDIYTYVLRKRGD